MYAFVKSPAKGKIVLRRNYLAYKVQNGKLTLKKYGRFRALAAADKNFILMLL
jgi:hypothetical protein